MTINDVQLASEEGSVTDTGKTYERDYHVYFSDGWSAAALLSNTHEDLPHKNDPLNDFETGDPIDTSVYVSNISVSLPDDMPAEDAAHDPFAIYHVTYSPKAFGFADNPLNKVEIEGGGSEIVESCQLDDDDLTIVNSTGDFVDPLPERPVPGGDFSITVYSTDNPATEVVQYSNSVNSETWHGQAAGTCRLGKISYSSVVLTNSAGTNINAYRKTYPVSVREDGWRLMNIDNGKRALDDDDNPTLVMDNNTNATGDAVLLDGAGGVLPPGDTPVVFPEDGYKILPEKNWSSLGIPNPFA